jgi:hypothetical protein
LESITKVAFEIGKAWREKTQLELVHSDLCTLNKPSLVGARYVLTFIDDFSRYTWVYFLKNKDHVFEKFKEFRALVEKQCG